MTYYNNSIYGINIPGYQSATTTGFFTTDRKGNARKLFSLPGQYIGIEASSQLVLTDTVYITQTITVTSTNTVTVTSTVIVYDCGTVTGINSALRSTSNISVYPNPSSTNISVVSNSGTPVNSVSVFNSQGTLVLTTSYFSTIDVSSWAKGLYLLEAKDEDGNILKTFKILKE
jgi:hypothetical protein